MKAFAIFAGVLVISCGIQNTAATCDPGYSYDSSVLACTECRVGSWSDGSMESCARPVQCSLGRGPKARATSPTDCMECPQGFYSNDDDATPCEMTTCLPGYSSTAIAAIDPNSTCEACHPGKYSVGTNDTCRTCPRGTYSRKAFGECLEAKCPIGSVAKLEAQSSTDCEECATGTFGAGLATPDCSQMECMSGSYPNDHAQNTTDCSLCSAGSYSPGGNQSCLEAKCPKGTYAPSGSSDAIANCQVCEAG